MTQGRKWNTKRGEGQAVQWLRDHALYAGDACLPWPFSRHPTGYGTFGHLGKIHYAHRFMCELVNGAAPDAKHYASHHCGNGPLGCVNPRHLSWKTNKENQMDRAAHGTMRKKGSRRFVLTHQIAAEIRAIGDRETKTALAKRYGTSRDTIAKILDGRAWNPAKWKLKFRGFTPEGDYVPLKPSAYRGNQQSASK